MHVSQPSIPAVYIYLVQQYLVPGIILIVRLDTRILWLSAVRRRLQRKIENCPLGVALQTGVEDYHENT